RLSTDFRGAASFLQDADGFLAGRDKVVRRAGLEPQPKARQLAGALLSALLQRIKTWAARRAKQRISKHRWRESSKKTSRRYNTLQRRLSPPNRDAAVGRDCAQFCSA